MESFCRNEYDNFKCVPSNNVHILRQDISSTHNLSIKYTYLLDKVKKKGLMESERKNICAIMHTNL